MTDSADPSLRAPRSALPHGTGAAAVTPIPDAPQIALVPGRAHEACGISRRLLALWLAARMTGPVIWITPAWCNPRPNPDGFAAWLSPARLTYVTPTRTEDLLWCLEESLRSGAAPLVVADLPGPPALTPVRRLHLACEAGGTVARTPLALILTPEGAAPGVETRWSMAPRLTPRGPGWHLNRLRARTAPQATWTLTGRSGAVSVLEDAPA